MFFSALNVFRFLSEAVIKFNNVGVVLLIVILFYWDGAINSCLLIIFYDYNSRWDELVVAIGRSIGTGMDLYFID